ncbi:MAG: DUF4405 domain-containing protein [Selenomonadaceae bacterium]|nr:DUF4405 domain-containing protein [Selenomonadaceae bacterium]
MRNLLNILMFAIFLLTISFHHLPKMLHEVLGILLLIAVLVHLYLNRKWFLSIKKGRRTTSRNISDFVDFTLLVLMIIVIVTGVFMSNYLFKGMFGIELARNITVHQLHVSLSYLMLILLGIHLGLHWEGLWLRFLNWRRLDKNSKSVRILSRVAPIILLIVGICGSFLNRIGDRLLMKHIFATEATNLPLAVFLPLMMGVVGMYAVFGYKLRK